MTHRLPNKELIGIRRLLAFCKERIVPLHDRVVEVLTAMKEGEPGAPIFVRQRHDKAMETAAKKAGLERFRLHDRKASPAPLFAAGVIAEGQRRCRFSG